MQRWQAFGNGPSRSRVSVRLSWVVTLALLTFAQTQMPGQQTRDPQNPGGQWEVLERCELLTNTIVDGDSFHVTHNDREYIFRLYFVDAPESDLSLRERIYDQAAYFGISPTNVLRGGELAAKFTRNRLSEGPFTVVTRWQNAGGRSQLARFYGIVLVKGTRLEESLVNSGWARIYGLRANWPEANRSSTYINSLKNLEIEARAAQKGLWNTNTFTRVSSIDAKTSQDIQALEITAENPIDPNTATFEELQKLPGIGPVYAERIIAHRPYQRVDDLKAVQGIGPVTLDKLRPLLRIEQTGD